MIKLIKIPENSDLFNSDKVTSLTSIDFPNEAEFISLTEVLSYLKSLNPSNIAMRRKVFNVINTEVRKIYPEQFRVLNKISSDLNCNIHLVDVKKNQDEFLIPEDLICYSVIENTD